MTSLFKSTRVSLFAAFIAGTFCLLMSFCVSSNLPSSLQSLQRLLFKIDNIPKKNNSNGGSEILCKHQCTFESIN